MPKTLDEIVAEAPVIGPPVEETPDQKLNRLVADAPDIRPSKLDSIANSAPVTDINKLGDFIADSSLTAFMSTLSGLSRLAPVDGSEGLQKIAKQQEDLFNEKYGDSDVAVGFKDALASLPAMLAPEAKLSDISKVASQLLDKMPSVAKSIADHVVRKGSQGAAVGVVSGSPDDSLLKSVVTGAGENIGLSSAGSAIKKGASNMLGNASGDKIIQSLEKLEELPATGADVLDSPMLRQAQSNELAYTPGVGQMSKSKKIKSMLQDAGDSIYKGLLGSNDRNSLLDSIKNSVLTRYHNIYKKIDKSYNGVIDYLRSNDLRLGNSNAKSYAQKALKKYDVDVKQQPALKDGDLKSLLTQYANVPDFAKMENNFGIRSLTPGADYEVAKAGKSQVYQLMQDSENAHTRGVLKGLYGAIKDDLSAAGDDTSRKMMADADELFKKELAPFKEKQLSKFIHEKMTPKQLVTKFIKTAKAEDPHMVAILSKVLSPEEKSMMGAHIFKDDLNADGSMNFVKMANRWKNMGDATKKAFFTKEQQESLNKLLDKKELSPTALSALVNPATGQTVERGDAAKMGYGLYGAAMMQPHLALQLLSPIIGARILQEAVNNKSLLRAIANAKNAPAGGKSTLSPALTSLLQSITR